MIGDTADGPVGAPEIPTRTGHNARLKVGSTTNGRVSTVARPRSAGSYRDLAGSSPPSSPPPPPSISSPFHRIPFLVPPPSVLPFVRPRLPLIPLQSWLPFPSPTPLLATRPLNPRARYAPPIVQDHTFALRRPVLLDRTFRGPEKDKRPRELQ